MEDVLCGASIVRGCLCTVGYCCRDPANEARNLHGCCSSSASWLWRHQVGLADGEAAREWRAAGRRRQGVQMLIDGA